MRVRGFASHCKKIAALGLLLSPLSAPTVVAAYERLNFRPGFNLFSSQQDVEVGRKAAESTDHQLPLVTDPEVVRYVNRLGKYLAQHAPNQNGFRYPWDFRVVNSADINAFALPGGFIYVNRGAIQAAEDEAQLAGVIAHEEGHVVMRHGTHQASEMMLAEAPLAILGGLLGQNSSLGSQLAQLGIGFGVNSILLKNSRGMEAQADQVGTYILYQSGYDPHAMAQFFEIIEKKYPDKTIEFLSDHPNPGNRIQAVDQEVPALGPVKQWKTDSPDFEAIKKRLQSLPPPPKGRSGARAENNPPAPPPVPSARLLEYRGEGFSIFYPDNWKAEASEGGVVTLAPPGGLVFGPDGDEAQAYGASISRYDPRSRDGNWGLVEATRQLFDSFQESNPSLRVLDQKGISLRGRAALSTWVENDSPLGGQKEHDRVITLRQGGKMLALVFIAPRSALDSYTSTFDKMLGTFDLH